MVYGTFKKDCLWATYWDVLGLLNIFFDLCLKLFTVCVTESYWGCHQDLQVGDPAVNGDMEIVACLKECF